MNKSEKVSLAFGIILALFAAFLMFDGQILGPDTAGIARVLGIMAIGFIAGGPSLLGKDRNRSEEQA
ncbi:MAG: hypothetical protein P1Q69_12495 [Candidatus Thorarchaeota archaeon]|nr:hypothetical protein [Candidatus Thorarchaeota archaeon]